MKWDALFNTFLHYSMQHTFIIVLVGTLILVMAVSWSLSLVSARLATKLAKHPSWDEPLLHSLYAPVMTLIWMLSITFLVAVLLRHCGVQNTDYFDITKLHQFTFVLVLFWFLIRYVRQIEAYLLDNPLTGRRLLNNKTNVRASAQMIRIAIFIVFGLSVMKSLGIEITTLLAFGGVGGLAVSFAAKIFGQFFGGMMVYWDRPFAEDWALS